ncbi:hypothetical protein [Sphingobacterium bovistauri]|uniref:Uncharacterized protein n=1 Tax=Sphingobacterium bovistauri TaxID=2781959 RepID=A0ABS7ZDK3_9SPHI|nr:hypothetical protein [Sphingobacterium bovistauri]MCA5006809.1 hypothetical protein [Sphingobacterium bovistauri]
MEIIQLIKIGNSNPKVENSIAQFKKLIEILNTKNLPENIVEKINSEISVLNSSEVDGNLFLHLLKKRQNAITKLIEKELKLVPKNHYRNLWLVLGMTAFGLPLGVVFGLSLGNIGLLGIGLPIGMAIGLLVGSLMDKKALENGKQLDIELK